jgi:hypothetical protein
VTTRGFKKSERGAAVAEFAVACLFFFTLLIGIIEFGRLLYTHSALTDAARRGARYASLHGENAACVRKIVIYGEKHVDSSCNPTGPPLVNGLDRAGVNINVTYAGADLDNDPDDDTPIDTSYGTNLGTATVTIENFNFTLGIPLLNLRITMPNYRTTMSAESAGEEPADL